MRASLIVRDMRHNPFYGLRADRLLRRRSAKQGRRIHGVKVLGGRDENRAHHGRQAPDAVVIAIPRAAASVLRSIVQALEGYKIPIQTLPSLGDLSRVRSR